MLKLLVFSLLSQLSPSAVSALPPGSVVPSGGAIYIPLIPGPAGPAGASIVGPAGPKGDPGAPGVGTASADPFSIVTYGAKPDGGLTDSAPAIQAAADAGMLVHVPAAPRSFGYAAPTYLDGSGQTVQGVGQTVARLTPTGGYIGPAIITGVKRLTATNAAAHRPPASALDAATSPGRFAVDTLGTHTLAISGLPMQLGSQGQAGGTSAPDYWQGRAYTIEALIEQTGPWTDFTYLLGFVGSDEPAPWALCAGATPGAFHLPVKFASQPPGTFTVYSFQAAATGPWGLCLQFDTVAGLAVWSNGKAVAVTSGIHGPGLPPPPGTPMSAHNGVFPLVIGSTYGPVANAPNGVTSLRVHGLNMTAGAKYGPNPIQTPVTGVPLADGYRYFVPLSTPALQTIGYLDLTCPPLTHVRVQGLAGWGVGLWIPATRPQWTATSTTFRDLSISSNGQAGVMVGDQLGLTMANVAIANGLQGLGTAGTGNVDYLFALRDCSLGGGDAAVVGYNWILDARTTQIGKVGRDAIRLFGCSSKWDGLYIMATAANQATVVDLQGGEAGQSHRFTYVVDDNETGVPSDSIIRAAQGACQTSLVVEGLYPSQAGPCPLIHLTGPGVTGSYPLAAFRGTDFGVFNMAVGASIAVKIDGNGWTGGVNTSGLAGAAAVIGSGITNK